MLSSLINRENFKTEELNKQAEKVEKCEEAAIYGTMRTMVHKFNVTKTTMIFKINIAKLIDKYPKLMKTSVALNVLKNYFKDIKQACIEYSNKSKWVKVIYLNANS